MKLPSKFLIGLSSVLSVNAFAHDNIISVLQINPYYSGIACDGGDSYDVQEPLNAGRHISSFPSHRMSMKYGTGGDVGHTQSYADTIIKYINKSDSQNLLSGSQIITTEAIPFVFHTPVQTDTFKGKQITTISYEEMLNEIRESEYINNYRHWLNADMIWVTPRCYNADDIEQFALSDANQLVTSNQPSLSPILIIQREAPRTPREEDAGREFGYIMTLMRDLDSQNRDKQSIQINGSGVGLLIDKGKNRYERTLMADCPESADNCKLDRKQPYSNGSVTVAYSDEVKANYKKTLDCKDKEKCGVNLDQFAPNSMAVIYDVLPKMMEWSDFTTSNLDDNIVFKVSNSRMYSSSDYNKVGGPRPNASLGTPYNDNYSTSFDEDMDFYITGGVDTISARTNDKQRSKVIIDNTYFRPDDSFSPINYTYLNFANSAVIENRTGSDFCLYLRKGTYDSYKELVTKYNEIISKPDISTVKQKQADKLADKISKYDSYLFSNLCADRSEESGDRGVMEVYYKSLNLIVGLDVTAFSSDITMYNKAMEVLGEKLIED